MPHRPVSVCPWRQQSCRLGANGRANDWRPRKDDAYIVPKVGANFVRPFFIVLFCEKSTKSVGVAIPPHPNAAQVWNAPSATNHGILPSFITFTRQRILS